MAGVCFKFRTSADVLTRLTEVGELRYSLDWNSTLKGAMILCVCVCVCVCTLWQPFMSKKFCFDLHHYGVVKVSLYDIFYVNVERNSKERTQTESGYYQN